MLILGQKFYFLGPTIFEIHNRTDINTYMYILTSAITKQTGCMKIHLEYFFQYPFREKNNGKCKKKICIEKKEYLTS